MINKRSSHLGQKTTCEPGAKQIQADSRPTGKIVDDSWQSKEQGILLHTCSFASSKNQPRGSFDSRSLYYVTWSRTQRNISKKETGRYLCTGILNPGLFQWLSKMQVVAFAKWENLCEACEMSVWGLFVHFCTRYWHMIRGNICRC